MAGDPKDEQLRRDADAFMEWCSRPENRERVLATADRILAIRAELSSAPEPPDCECNFDHCEGEHVYFVRCGAYIKIGYAKQPSLRIAMLRTGNPMAIEPVLLLPGTRLDEANWHRRFVAQRERGEWFRIEDELAEFLASDEASGLAWDS
jgi:hypothetical protein